MASILFTGCSYIHQGGTEGPVQYDTLRIPKTESEYYFQLKGSRYDSINNAVDTFRNQWFSHFLFRMKEPIIHEYKGSMEIYRFTWLRTFHHPVVLRLEKKEDSARLMSKVAEGAGGYYCGEMLLDTILSISIEHYDSLIYEIAGCS